MEPLPAPAVLRSNRGTWAVPASRLPAVGNWMHDVLPNERYDPHFVGQSLTTTYFDTVNFALRKARRRGNQYLTLRVRCYPGKEHAELYALSAKTEDYKWRVEISSFLAHPLLNGADGNRLIASLLPADLQARLLALVGEADLLPIVAVCCRRYAVEDNEDRYTLDVNVETDVGKCLPYGVLEYKSTKSDSPDGSLGRLGVRPIKLSKFLWATEV